MPYTSPALFLGVLALRVLLVLAAAPPPTGTLSSAYPQDTGEDQVAAASSLSDVELDAGDEVDDAEDGSDSSPDSQHLFPSFSAIFPPLGHSRPSFFPESNRGFQVETFRYTPRSNPTIVFHDTPTSKPATDTGRVRTLRTQVTCLLITREGGSGSRSGQAPKRCSGSTGTIRNSNLFSATSNDGEDGDTGMLGSGNFGVIRGGTYYSGGAAAGDDSAFLRGNNAHSRPYRRPNPPPLYRGGGDFFQGFRDFADITTPSKGAYSQYVVVYANRKGEPAEVITAPRNIMEQLEMLEAEEKRSKNKKKLEAYKEKERSTDYKKKNKKFPKQDLLEPLLALS